MGETPTTALRKCLGVHLSDGTVSLDFFEDEDAAVVFMWLEDLIGDEDAEAAP